MKKIVIIIILFLSFISCKKRINEKNKVNEFISRLHTPEFDIDYYKMLGTTSLEKHIIDFQKINWKDDFLGGI